jgi:hypothetical protein
MQIGGEDAYEYAIEKKNLKKIKLERHPSMPFYLGIGVNRF